MSGRVARTVEDVVLGEAVHGTMAERYADMVAIASVVSNRAMTTGVSPLDVVSSKREFNAFAKALPQGVEAYRDLARMAIAEVETYGPATNATFFSTPKTVGNLPADLQQTMQTKGHVYFSDPMARPIGTAVGYRAPVNPMQASMRAAPAPSSIEMGFAPAANQNAAPRTAASAMLDRMATVPHAQTQALSSIPGPTSAWDGSFSNPVGAYTDNITSGFGPRSSPMGIGSKNHKGIDLSAAPGMGGYPAEAAAPGVVTAAGPAGGFGNMVEVTHPNGMVSRYGHLASINVSIGDDIARGTPVGIVGTTGTSTAPHLHFDVTDQFGTAIDPESIMDFSMRAVPTPTARPVDVEAPTLTAYAPEAPSAVSTAPASAPMSSPDSSRFGGLPGPSQARFGPVGGLGGLGGISVSSPYSPAGDYATATNSAAPKGDRLARSFDVARYGPDAAAMAASRVSSPFSPDAGYATAQAPTGTPSADRFARAVEPDVGRYASVAPASMAKAAGPMSPAEGYAMATGPVLSPARPDNSAYTGPKGVFDVSPAVSAAAASQQRGLAGTINAAPPTAVKSVSVSPASVSNNVLGNKWASVPAGPLGFATDFVPGPIDMTNVTAYAPAPRTLQPVAISAPALPAPRTIRQVPVYQAPQGNFPARPAAPPSLSVSDVYGGKVGTAVASDGSKVSRDNFGVTSVTNGFGVTTGMDAHGKQTAYGPGPSFGGFGELSGTIGAGLRSMAGPAIGSAIGSALAGPVGGLVGGIVGRNLTNDPAATSKVGGLGGLGGIFGGIFGGGQSSSSGGKSGGGKSGSTAGGKSSGARGYGGNAAGSARSL